MTFSYISHRNSWWIGVSTRAFVFVVICGVLAVLAVALCACSSGATRSVSAQGDIGAALDVDVQNQTDPAKPATVQATLVSYSVGQHLPQGFEKKDVSIYNSDREAYNKDNGLYTIDDAGSIGNGWSLVSVELHYRNDNDFACRLSLHDPHLARLDDDQNREDAISLDPWIIGSHDTPQDYYLPLLDAHAQADYTIGFFVPTDFLTGDTQLVMEDRTDPSGTDILRVFSLGDASQDTQHAEDQSSQESQSPHAQNSQDGSSR